MTVTATQVKEAALACSTFLTPAVIGRASPDDKNIV